MNKCVLVINPSSGNEMGQKIVPELKKTLMSNFDQVIVKYTEKVGDATKFVQDAVDLKAKAYFVVGGDGTVNEAINGLAKLDEPMNFGFLPVGTANDLARALGIPLDPYRAIKAYHKFHMQPIDIAKINDDYYMNVAAIGSIPDAVNHTSTEDKSKFGFMAYVRDGFNALRKSDKLQTYDIIIDGEHQQIQTELILLALTNSVGSFENMIGDAKVDDGKLHFVALNSGNILQEGVELVRNFVDGDLSNAQNITYEKVEVIEIRQAENSSKEIETNVDGDPGPKLPVRVEIVPSKINVMVPEP